MTPGKKAGRLATMQAACPPPLYLPPLSMSTQGCSQAIRPVGSLCTKSGPSFNYGDFRTCMHALADWIAIYLFRFSTVSRSNLYNMQHR